MIGRRFNKKGASQPMKIARFLILAALTLPLLHACAKQDFAEEKERLNEAKQKWVQRNSTQYDFFLIRNCYCAYSGSEVVLSVQGGVLAEVKDSGAAGQSRFTVAQSDYNPAENAIANRFWTVEEAFNKIQEALDQRVELLEVTYDEESGFPTRIEIDYSKNTMRDELDLRYRKYNIY